MSKRPFNKIRKIEKKENIEEGEQNREEMKIEQTIQRQNTNKPPKFSLEKKKIRIGNNQTKNNELPPEPEPKNALGSKPNLFKGKKDGGKFIINSNRNTSNVEDAVEESYAQAPKPTPLVIKKRLNFDPLRKQRENIVIEQDGRAEGEQSESVNVEESTSLRRKPDLKVKRFLQKRQPSEKISNIEESNNESSFNPPDKEQPYLSPAIQYREVSMEPSAAAVSEGKLEKQKKRTYQLKNLLNLQADLYEQTLTIGSVTAYEIYINKIKGGFLKNSNDQSFDDTTTSSCQTLSLDYSDFTNQCPQDYSLDASRIDAIDPSASFDHFILKVAPVIQELMKPTDLVTEPPIFLLAFRPTFKTFLKCPYPLFVYRSEEYKLDLVVVGEKLFITQGEIESVLMVGKNMVAGLRDGYLVFWSGENNKSSRLYEQIREFTQSTNFELPSYSTHHLERYSSYSTEFGIPSLLKLSHNHFLSLDATGKMVQWSIEEGVNNSLELRAGSVVELRSLTQHWALQAYGIRQRGESFYANTSLGLICLQNNEIRQRLDTAGIKIRAFQVPKKSPLVYSVSQDNTLLIYNQLYSHPLLEIQLQISDPIREIVIPELQHENRELLFLFIIYLIDESGNIYQVRLLENRVEFVRLLGKQEEQRRDKNLIFKGVTRIGDSLQTVRLMRDLKITTSFSRMNVPTDKSIPALKSILEKNRELMAVLEQQSVMIAS